MKFCVLFRPHFSEVETEARRGKESTVEEEKRKKKRRWGIEYQIQNRLMAKSANKRFILRIL